MEGEELAMILRLQIQLESGAVAFGYSLVAAQQCGGPFPPPCASFFT